MKQWKATMNRLSIIQMSVILLVIGLVFGILFANVFREQYYQQLEVYQNTVFTEITISNIDYYGLFLYIITENFKEFAVFWLLSITILGIPYMAYKIASFGFTTGFFISSITMHYGVKGLLLILVYPFPHGIIYLPIALLCLYKGFYLCRSINYDKHKFMGTLKHQLKQYLLLLIVLSILILFASFIEAYVGSFFLKKTLNLFT